MAIHIGTSGWAYKEWKPAFYPDKLAQAKFLQHYATRLNTVEVNASFRQLLKQNVVEKWIGDTTESFVFCIKAHQMITHFRRLRDVESFTQAFVGSLRPLEEAKKLGPVLFQLPPDFKADNTRLDEFLAQLPPGLRTAFEFRHESWLSDPTYAVLEKRGAALCVAESEELVVPDVATAKYSYYRLRKPDYAPAALEEIISRLRACDAAGRDVFAFFKHEDRPEGALNAERVLAAATAKAAWRSA